VKLSRMRTGLAATALAIGTGGVVAVAGPASASTGEPAGGPTGCWAGWADNGALANLAVQAQCSGGSGYYQLQVNCQPGAPGPVFSWLHSTQYSSWHKAGSGSVTVWCPPAELVGSYKINKET
jgi:hypothetical protein